MTSLRHPAFQFHALGIDETAAHLATTRQGLGQGEVESRQRAFGPNELAYAPAPPKWKLFLEQFQSPVVWLLVAAAMISGVLGEWLDSAAIAAIVLVNGALGFWQEDRSRRALEALKSLSAPSARVVRDGVALRIASRELVPGDRIELESGDHVPADARLISSVRLAVGEAALTGESDVVEKSAEALLHEKTPLAERRNMVFSGTTIAVGKAAALVVATGMQTELGRIAGLLERETPEPTPLERRLEELGKVLMAACVLLVLVIFALHLWRGGPLVDVFLSAVSLAVAAVPEGLPAVVTTALALGLNRMVKRNALVRKLASVETLGSVTVICSDKTGTLTRNEMTVVEVVAGDGRYRVTGAGFQPRGAFLKAPDDEVINVLTDADLMELVYAAACCTTAQIRPAGDGRPWTVIGDPMEGALLMLAAKAGTDFLTARKEVLHEIPFESERKAMSVVVALEDAARMFTKGAPEVVLANSTHEWVRGDARPMGDARRNEWLAIAGEMAQRALRVLAFARRDFPRGYAGEFVEADLALLGLVGLVDPPREEARTAVSRVDALRSNLASRPAPHPPAPRSR